MSSTATPAPRRCATSAVLRARLVWSPPMLTRAMGWTGARSAGNVGSDVPARTTVTRRAASVSAASGVTWPPASSSTVAPTGICRASASAISRNRIADTSLPSVHHANVRQVAKLLVEVEAVADDEPIGNLEADVVDRHVDLPARRLAQQSHRPQAGRLARGEDVEQIVQRKARIEDVFDHHDVAARQRMVEILDRKSTRLNSSHV